MRSRLHLGSAIAAAPPSTRLSPATSEAKPAQEEHAREWIRPLLGIGGWLVASVGLGLILHASARAPRPVPVQLTHTIALADFGLRVVLPSTWKVESDEARADFVASHSETGAILTGIVRMSAPPAPELDTILDGIIEAQRGSLGNLGDIRRGVLDVGLLEARWLKVSFVRQGELLRTRTVVVQRGLRTLTLTCTGGTASQKACDAVVHTVHMAH